MKRIKLRTIVKIKNFFNKYSLFYYILFNIITLIYKQIKKYFEQLNIMI